MLAQPSVRLGTSGKTDNRRAGVYSNSHRDQVPDDVLQGTAFSEDGSLTFGAVSTLHDPNHAFELGFATEILRSVAQGFDEVSGCISGGSTAVRREIMETSVEAVRARATCFLR